MNNVEVPKENQSNFIPIRKDEKKLLMQAYDKSVEVIISMIEKGKIILNPEFQRSYVWDTKKASLLIESIILNVPIPTIYVAQEEKHNEKEIQNWLVVDGVQRLTALKNFYDGKFKLKDLEVLGEDNNGNLLNGLHFENLPMQYKNKLNYGLIRVVLIASDSNPEIKYNMFMRLNSGSVQLNEQELRNCLYRGLFNEALKNELRQNEFLLKLLQIDKPSSRFFDVEVILRFLAISQNWNNEQQIIENYKNSMKNFLNKFMYQNRKINTEKIQEYKLMLDNTLEKVYEVLGDNAFCKINKNKEYKKKWNVNVMDCVMLGFSLYEKEVLLSKKNEIFEMMYELMQDNLFQTSLTTSTTNTEKMTFRISTFLSHLNRVING